MKAIAPPTDDEIGDYRDLFRQELDKRMDTNHPSGSPSTEAHAIALRRFVNARNARQLMGPLTLDDDRRVFFYEQDHYYLSNFSAFKVNWRGVIFPTSEQAYHWSRFPHDSPERTIILESASAHEAYRFAQENKAGQVGGWDSVKVDVMRDILRAKARAHNYIRRKLPATGDRELIENSWRDPFWGWGPNRDGQNVLGRLWMSVRDELNRGVL